MLVSRSMLSCFRPAAMSKEAVRMVVMLCPSDRLTGPPKTPTIMSTPPFSTINGDARFKFVIS